MSKNWPSWLVLVAAGLLVTAAACSSSSKSAKSTATTGAKNGYSSATMNYATDGSSGSSSSAGSSSSSSGGSSSSSSGAGGSSQTVVSVSTAGGKPHLVSGSGRTLYLFEKDQGSTSACKADPCKAAWPAFSGTNPSGMGGINASKLGTADGQVPNQVTYFGHLLYYFSGDTAADQMNGAGIPNWYLVDPTTGNSTESS